MSTGRDVANFVTKMTGKNFVGLYDDSVNQEEMMKTEAQNKFKSLVERMQRVDKKNSTDIIA